MRNLRVLNPSQVDAARLLHLDRRQLRVLAVPDRKQVVAQHSILLEDRLVDLILLQLVGCLLINSNGVPPLNLLRVLGDDAFEFLLGQINLHTRQFLLMNLKRIQAAHRLVHVVVYELRVQR